MLKEFWHWLSSPCVFGHAERVMELWPAEPGDVLPHRYVQVCPRCRDAHVVSLVPL